MPISKQAAIHTVKEGGAISFDGKVITRVQDLPADDSVYGTDVPMDLVLPEPEPVPEAPAPVPAPEPAKSTRKARTAPEVPAEEKTGEEDKGE